MIFDATPINSGSAKIKSIDVGGFRITDAFFPSGLTIPNHYHEFACCAIVLEGAVDKAFSSQAYETPASTVVTMPPVERHQDQFSSSGARILVVEPKVIQNELLRPCRDVFERIHHFRDAAVAGLAWNIAKELRFADKVMPLAINGLVLELIALVTRRGGADQVLKQAPIWLAQAQEIIHERFVESLGLSDIADIVGVHPVHLARVFRQYHGMSLGSYLRRLRLEWATTQLISSVDAPLSDVATRAGFSDQSHFSRLFKQQKGVTPTQFRQLIHG